MDSVQELVKRARAAQQVVKRYTQAQIDEVCLAVAWQMYNDQSVDKLSRLAADETGYGNYESKVVKHKRKIGGVIQDVLGAVSVGCIERNPETGISKYAKPVGVVCAILPATNPTATAGGNVVSILKGRNAVIFRPSSRAAQCSKLATELMREGLRKVGAPEDLVLFAEHLDIPATSELMQLCDVVVATGGAPMVRAAYSSGTPSYGVGVGNAVALVAEDADVPQAAAMVASSKTFDNATSCSSENSLIIHSSRYAEMVEALRRSGGHLCTAAERKILQDTLWKPNAKGKLALNPDIVAQSAQKIAAMAGIHMDPGDTMLLVEGALPAELDIFSQEKLSPVLTLYPYDDFEAALETYARIARRCGYGHSAGIHTFKREYIERMGEILETSRVTVRQPMAAANGGHATNRMPSTTTLGCGTWGRNSTTENINYRHFLNITWVNEPVAAREFSEEKIWGAFWKKFGK
jgi:sulfoacetaldehyde dehydrogenase